MPASKGDNLKKPEETNLPDSRSPMLGLRSITDQYERIQLYELADYVPEKVATQYELARNLYLYAYHVYRFYMVAQHQVLITLEFSIKECIGKKKIKRYGEKIKKGSGLAVCLHYIFDKCLIENTDFPIWQDRRRVDAEHQYQIKKIEEMQEKGLESIELDYDDIDYDDIDYEGHALELDYLEMLSKNMPDIRNRHAHGTSMLHNQVRTTFENVSVIINKIYKPDS